MLSIQTTLKNLQDNFKLAKKAFFLSYTAAPLEIICLICMILLQGLAIPLGVWLSKLVIDGIVQGFGGQAIDITFLTIAWGANLLLGFLLSPWISLLTSKLNERLTAQVSLKLIQKTNSIPDLTAFETPEFYDSLQIVNRESNFRPINLVVTSITLLRNAVTAAGLLFLLGTLSWWLPFLVLISTYPQTLLSMNLEKNSWRTLLSGQTETRLMQYYQTLSTTDQSAKEIRIFGLGSFLENRYQSAFHTFHARMDKDRQRLAFYPIPTTLLATLGNLGAFWYVVNSALTNKFEIGAVLLLVQSLGQLTPRLSEFSAMAGLLGSHLLFFKKFFDFLDYETKMDTTGQKKVPTSLTEGITFKNVSFSYSDKRQALKNISFEIKPGEKVAIVGENGAGKSTIVKLLCRLYDPSNGIITVEGQNLKHYDLLNWRQQLGTVFQDFGQYSFTIAENIALGNLGKAFHSYELESAAQLAGLTLSQFPQGINTPLGKQFGGTELSGGQWQKIAIARAFFKNSTLLILDEPTAALDPRAEHALFNQFAQLAKGKTVLFITHRLASVSMADRILVFKEGCLVENGSHSELMRAGGEYATLYRLQAEQYDLAPSYTPV